jgi:hypothetical protein
MLQRDQLPPSGISLPSRPKSDSERARHARTPSTVALLADAMTM